MKILAIISLLSLSSCYGFWCNLLTEQGQHNCYGTPNQPGVGE